MAIELIDKIKQKNAGTFPLVDVEDLDPTQGAVADGSLLKRSGSEIVGATGKIGETQFEVNLPLSNPLIASARTDIEAYRNKKPYNVDRRINKIYAVAASNVGGDCTFKLQKNGVDVTGATITIPSGAQVPTSSTPVSFTEVTLADGDILTIVQTTARTDAINMTVYIYGDQDIVTVVS